MKKCVTFLITLLLVLPFFSAVQFEMKSEFKQGETLMANLSGVFLQPITAEDVSFYRGHVRVPLTPYVFRADDNYYIYAELLGKEPNNYSIKIENVKYQKGVNVIEEDLEKSFTITNETADFYVDPGFIFTDRDFSIKVQNLNENSISITFDSPFSATPSSPINLKTGEMQKINFAIDTNDTNATFVKLSSTNTNYSVQIYLFTNITESEKSFKFQPAELNVPLLANYTNSTKRMIYLENTGTETIENITLSVSQSLDEYVLLGKYFIDDLDADQSAPIEVYFSPGAEEKTLTGVITANSNNSLYEYVFISLNITSAYTPLVNETVEHTSIYKKCSEYTNGKICNIPNTCNGTIVSATDGNCCMGECSEPGTGGTGKLIGWILIAAVVLFLAWFFLKKYRGTRNIANLMKIAERK